MGRQLVRTLLAKGQRVVCVVRRPTALTEEPLFSSPGVSLLECDFTQEGWEEQIAPVLSSCRAIFHLAGAMPHTSGVARGAGLLRKINVEVVQRLYRLAASNQVGKFLFVSSLAVYGESFPEPRDETAKIAPEGLYARTKAEAEGILVAGAMAGGPAALIVRPGLIYGERDVGVIQRLIALIDRGYFRILGNGHNTRSISSVRLVVEALCALAESEEQVAVINVVDPQLPTMARLAVDIADLLGVPRPRHLPLSLAYPVSAVFSALASVGVRSSFKLSDVRKISTSNLVRGERLRKLLGGIPNYYQESLAADVAWYRRGGS